MKIYSPVKRPLVAAIALIFLTAASGCATNPDGTRATNPDGSPKMDERAKGALLGAFAGCALASMTGKECAKGAVVGAIAGFLVSWYFESKKLASAQEVNQEYVKVKAITPPKEDVIPASFETKVTQTKPDDAGEKEIKLTSSTDMIGYGDKVPDVQQKYAIYDEDNKLVEEKTEKIASVDGAGRYQTSSKFKLPASAKGKTYTVKTSLVSNGQTYKQKAYKVAFLDDGRIVSLAMAN